MDLDRESLAQQKSDNQSVEADNDDEYETQSDDDPWQDTELIDYWDASLTGYKSYHNKDENPAVLIPAPRIKKKTLGKRKRVKFDDQVQETKEVEQEATHDETVVEQQQQQQEEHIDNNDDQQYDYQQYDEYYQQQYPQTARPPPPPPPMPGMAGNGAAEDEAFSNLIMAWYYSGYYTGYYQAQYRNRNG
ncbi:hypothetical protein BJV82DRAFT_619188 [Fennellomyces sp. T-0311]|nr:hypothetical protein BJV82DRAFT_619188 [Fennellomyces sp. T-0311]